MCVYLYCRISRKKQNIDRQVRNLTALYPQGIVIKEAYTGTKIDRPEWNKLYKKVKTGDTIAFDSVSRMSRDAEEGFTTYEALFNKGVDLVFLNEPYVNTSTFKNALNNGVPMTGTNVDCILEGVNKFLMELAKEQIRLAFQQAQKEVDDLHTRVSQGIETARLNGKQIGGKTGSKYNVKKSAEAKAQIKKYSKDFDGTLNDTEVITLTGISRKTYYKYKKEMKANVEWGKQRQKELPGKE